MPPSHTTTCPSAWIEIVGWLPRGSRLRSTGNISSGSVVTPLVGKRVSALVATPVAAASSRSFWSAQDTSFSTTSRAAGPWRRPISSANDSSSQGWGVRSVVSARSSTSGTWSDSPASTAPASTVSAVTCDASAGDRNRWSSSVRPHVAMWSQDPPEPHQQSVTVPAARRRPSSPRPARASGSPRARPPNARRSGGPCRRATR